METAAGVFAGIDFGGRGTDVLLVHGTGQNSAAWEPVAAELRGGCHPVAIDLRGHGQTPVDSCDAEQYWRDLGPICAALNLRRPVLVGHSTGGYAVTAATVAGLVEPSGVCVVDGFVPDTRAIACKAAADADWQIMADQLRAQFRYGWVATDDERTEYVEQVVRDADHDWLNAGVDPDVLRAVTARSFARFADDRWLRRPTLAEIDTVRRPREDADIYPSVEVYERVSAPLALILAADGLYAAHRELIEALAADRPNRVFVELPGGHNVHLLHPRDVADAVVNLVRVAEAPTTS